MPEEALAVLRDHREQQDGDRALFEAGYCERNLVFCRPDGEYYVPGNLGKPVRELADANGLKGVGLHMLRHSHASQLLSNGTPIPTVSKGLGHANPNITLQIYSHALEADELAAAKVWNDAMAEVISANRKSRRKAVPAKTA